MKACLSLWISRPGCNHLLSLDPPLQHSNTAVHTVRNAATSARPQIEQEWLPEEVWPDFGTAIAGWSTLFLDGPVATYIEQFVDGAFFFLLSFRTEIGRCRVLIPPRCCPAQPLVCSSATPPSSPPTISHRHIKNDRKASPFTFNLSIVCGSAAANRSLKHQGQASQRP